MEAPRDQGAAASSSSSGGGKLTRRAFRPRSTPYDRPPREVSQQQQRGRAGGWLSKLVKPATRLIPSIFFSSSSKDEDEGPPLESIPENEQEDYGDSTQKSESQLPELGAGTSAGTGEPKVSFKLDVPSGDKQAVICPAGGLAEIEERLKHKMFTRDESNRLIELLRSRITDLPNGDEHASGSARETAELTPVQKDSRLFLKGDINDSHLTLKTAETLQLNSCDISSSPVDIAKAYMEGQKSACLGIHQSNRLRDEKKVINNDTSALFLPLAAKSPTCWPGAVVNDQGYLTPQTQSGRIGYRSIPRTPRSGSLFSRSTSKFQGGGERFNPSLTGRKQSCTPVFGGNSSKRSSVLNDGFTSVDPLCTTRQKNMAATTSNGVGTSNIGSPSNIASSFQLLSDGPFNLKGISSNLHGKLEQNPWKGTYRNFDSVLEDELPGCAAGSPTVHPQSSKMAQKIFEHLNRPVSLKERSLELELVVGRKKIPQESVAMMSDGENRNHDVSISDNHESGFLLGKDMGAQKSIDAKILMSSSIRESQEKDKLSFMGQLSSISHQTGKQGRVELDQSNAGSHQFHMSKALPHSSQETFPASTSYAQHTEKIKNSDNGFGFTFPVPQASSIILEPPPTPTMNSSITASRVLPRGEEAVPVFNFGSSKSDNRLVFSFSSTTTSTINDDTIPKFVFGSSKHNNLSFESVAKDAICYS